MAQIQLHPQAVLPTFHFLLESAVFASLFATVHVHCRRISADFSVMGSEYSLVVVKLSMGLLQTVPQRR